MQDNSPMHVLISHAAPLGPQCQEAITQVALPRLSELLSLLTPTPPMLGSPESLTPLSERVRANSLGLQGADGLIPWAALDAQHLGLTKTRGDAGWAWITPCHLNVQSNHVDMEDPRELDLSTAECETLRTAMHGYFAEDGVELHPLSDGIWLAFGAVLRDLPTASIERVAGAAIDHWMPQQEQAKPIRRLQNEMQMLLYTHPVNDARSARGVSTVNAFWVSGTGTPQGAPSAATERLEYVDALRQPAMGDDAQAWLAAWAYLDATVLADLVQRAKSGKTTRITLCGERMAATLELQDKPWWSRIQQRFSTSSPAQLLQSL
jgi:hypothetical protein